MDTISITIKDACKATGLGRTKIYELINAGRLQAVKIGGRRLIKTASIRAMLEG